MNGEELVQAVSSALQDPSYESEDILNRINQGLIFLATQRPLPQLQVSSVVSSVPGQDYVPMPDDFYNRLFAAYNQTKKIECVICYTRKTLDGIYAGINSEEGDIQYVVDEGGFLYYKLVPVQSQDIKLTYYTKPAKIEEYDDSIPYCIPKGLHHQTLVMYALWDIFTEIEDGLEGQKINTNYYGNQFATGLEMLKIYCPDPSKPRRYYPRKAKTF